MKSNTSKIKSTEDALQQAADIFSNIQLGIYIYHLEDINDDRTLKMVAANPITEKLTGVPVKDIIGNTLDENFPGLRKKGIPQKYAEVVRTQKSIEIEDLYYSDERVMEGAFYVRAFPLPNNKVGVSFENITNRKKAEEDLRISEEKHRQLIETMNEGFAIVDESGILTYVNSKLCNMMGYNREEVMNHPTTDFLDKTDIANMQKHTISRTNKRSIPYEIEWIKKDGNKLPTIVSPKPIFDDKGKFIGSMAVLTDISTLKKIETELLNKNKELESTLKKMKEMQTQLILSEKMASLGQITAGVAHEINNPVNYVKGNINPLKSDIRDVLELVSRYENTIKEHNLKDKVTDIENFKQKIDYSFLIEEIDSLIKGIEDGTERVAEIIKSLRNFSRQEKEEFVESDIHEGLDSTLVILNNLIKDRIVIHKDYGKMANIKCLPGKLNQVFMNVLTNSIQAIEDKGDIFVRTYTDEENLNISIRDTGIGMTEAVVNHVFEPFFSTKEPGKGTGLGLSISYSIIEKHSGNIKVNSKPGVGTEFIISLPLKRSDV